MSLQRYTKRKKDYTKPLNFKPISLRYVEQYIPPEIMADSLKRIIEFILKKVPLDKRIKRRNRIKDKIKNINIQLLSTTNMPEAASIGQALTIVKNMLFGKDASYINYVIKELAEKL